MDPDKGLFRTVLVGPGHTLNEAFANLENARCVERIWRHPLRKLLGARVSLARDEGEGFWDFTQIRDDVYVVTQNFAYRDPRVELLSGDGLIQFYFKLSGDLTMAITRAKPLRLNRPSLLIYQHPLGLQISEWTAPNARERSVAVMVRPDALIDEFLPEPDKVPAQLAALLRNGNGSKIEYCQLPLSAAMFELATKLVDNPYSGRLALIYTEAVVAELLCAAVDSIGTLSEAPHEQYTYREMRCLHSARSVLMSHLAHPPTIRQLAREAGINQTTLKRGFKAIFGETILDFSVRCRMQRALVLLREQRIAVAQVAKTVGYSHQTSFATAFRRHFGLRPKDVRSGRNL